MLTIKLLVDWMYLFVGFFSVVVDFLFCFDKDQRDGDNVVPEIYSFQLNIFWKKIIFFVGLFVK